MTPTLTTRQRLQEYGKLMRLDRPIGILLLLWPTLWALWIAAEGIPDPLVLFVFCAGVILMRSAGCVINDFADRNVDAHVERTRNRPLAQKRIAAREALYLFVALSLLAFALVLLMNPLTIALSVGGVILAASYPFMKRYTHLPQVHLGAAFGWAIPMAFAAQTGHIPIIAWLIYLINLLWITAYDTQYAMVDRADDLKIGIKSTAILFGDADRLIIGLLQVLALTGLLLLGQKLDMHIVYYGGLLIAAALVVYQQLLIRHRDTKACFNAFLNNNWLGAAIFGGIFFNYLLVSK